MNKTFEFLKIKTAEEAGYTLDNPNFQIFYMSNVDSTIYDEDGSIIISEKF